MAIYQNMCVETARIGTRKPQTSSKLVKRVKKYMEALTTRVL